MVRVNIINPRKLSDQHLVAEYLEILMLVSHTRKYPYLKEIPKDYCLGTGHIKFFTNKLLYLKKRHELLKKEMKRRGFKAEKTLKLNFKKELLNNWRPKPCDKKIIIKRITEKIIKKPNYYRYYGEKKSLNFFIKLMKAQSSR